MSRRTGVDGQRARQVRLIDLLCEWLERVGGRDEEGEAGDDHERRGAVPRRSHAQTRRDAQQHEAGDARRGEAKDALPVASPHRQAPADASEPHPRLHAGSVLGELASKDDDGAEVLHRHREAKLADEARAPFSELDRDAADRPQPDEEQHTHRDHTEQVDPVNPERPDGDAPDRRRRRGDDLGEVERGPCDDERAEDGRRRRRESPARLRTARRRRRALR